MHEKAVARDDESQNDVSSFWRDSNKGSQYSKTSSFIRRPDHSVNDDIGSIGNRSLSGLGAEEVGFGKRHTGDEDDEALEVGGGGGRVAKKKIANLER